VEDYDDLLKQFKTIVEDSTEQPAELREAEEAPAIGKDNALARFCVDFTAKAKTGEIDPVFGRDREIRQMVDILARRLTFWPGGAKTIPLWWERQVWERLR